MHTQHGQRSNKRRTFPALFFSPSLHYYHVLMRVGTTGGQWEKNILYVGEEEEEEEFAFREWGRRIDKNKEMED